AGMRWEVIDQRQLEMDLGAKDSARDAAHAFEVFGSRLPARLNIEPNPAVGGLHDLVLRYPSRLSLREMYGNGVRMDAAPFRQAQIVDAASLDFAQVGKRLAAAARFGPAHCKIAGAVTNERHRVRVQRRRNDFANLPRLHRTSVFADDLDEHVVVADVISVAVRTLPCEQIEFVRAIEIDQRRQERALDLAPRRRIEDLASAKNQPRPNPARVVLHPGRNVAQRRRVAAYDVRPVSEQICDELLRWRQTIESLLTMDAERLPDPPGPAARRMVERKLAEARDAIEGTQTGFRVRAQAKEIQQMIFARRTIDVERLAR